MRSLPKAALLIVLSAAAAYSQTGRREFLTPDEINAIQDEQDSGKRVLLYLKFAGRRLDAVRQKAPSSDPDAGEAIQEQLAEYNSIWDAIADSLDNARHNGDSLSKPLGEMQSNGTAFLRYLQSLASGAGANHDAYSFTLDEAIATTKDGIADAKQGFFAKAKPKPPSDMPVATPAPSAGDSGSDNPEEGPPRKKRSPSQTQ